MLVCLQTGAEGCVVGVVGGGGVVGDGVAGDGVVGGGVDAGEVGDGGGGGVVGGGGGVVGGSGAKHDKKRVDLSTTTLKPFVAVDILPRARKSHHLILSCILFLIFFLNPGHVIAIHV